MNQKKMSLSVNCPQKFKMIVLNQNLGFLPDENFAEAVFLKCSLKKVEVRQIRFWWERGFRLPLIQLKSF